MRASVEATDGEVTKRAKLSAQRTAGVRIATTSQYLAAWLFYSKITRIMRTVMVAKTTSATGHAITPPWSALSLKILPGGQDLPPIPEVLQPPMVDY